MAYLTQDPAAAPAPVRIGLIGSGWMGAFHAESIARRVPGAVLAAIADPNVESAGALARVPRHRQGHRQRRRHPGRSRDRRRDHRQPGALPLLPDRARPLRAGKHVFCEKPAGQGLDELDAALAAVEAAGVHFQVGFNRRYADGLPGGQEGPGRRDGRDSRSSCAR